MKIKALLFLACALILSGCLGGGGGDNGGGNPLPSPTPTPAPGNSPTPTPTPTPTPSDLRVLNVQPSGPVITVDQQITVTFDKSIDMASLTVGTGSALDNVRLVAQDPHPINVTISGATLTIVPTISLDPNTRYSLMITNSLRATDGSSLPQAYVVNYQTEAGPPPEPLVLALTWCYPVSPPVPVTHYIANWGTQSGIHPTERTLSYDISPPTQEERATWCTEESDFNMYRSVIEENFEHPATYYIVLRACNTSACSIPTNEVWKRFD